MTHSPGTPGRLVLASASPRRQEMLSRVGFEVEVFPVSTDETPRPGETPQRLVVRLAREKAAAAAARRPGRFVLGADTIVVIDDQVIGKPGSREEARAFLEALSGRWHHVLTGVALVCPGEPPQVDHASTAVRFAALCPEEIADYTSGREPYDKAGAYAIQGIAGWFVEEIRGSVSNVVGLPLERVRRLLRESGFPPPRLR